MMWLVGGTISGGIFGLYIQDKLIRKYEADRDAHIKQLLRKDEAAAAAAAVAAAEGDNK